ncbi:MAG: exonuclease SbcCD subunit D C-terminal domain-containing protein [SAR324 cluster bacterium]|nr:exonuclease SbcCD subunit D C-terminal domain-containing protein [SAR324 cluster bacterium]
MKLIHTSDWHLGRMLYGRKRYDEFGQFLDWLATFIEQNAVNALLVAGDIFDTTAPSNRALQLYYQFLHRISQSDCRHVIIIGGNHDSPSLLNAPREVLRSLNVHVVGRMADSPDEENFLLNDNSGVPELMVCAVPFLRDRDVRQAEAGESIEEKGQKLIRGIQDHYKTVVETALRRCEELQISPPLVGMGHLFTAGGQTADGDGVRDLYVGSLAHLTSDTFPAQIDYLALGHLHVPQKVGESEFRRYSGSPIPMNFGEAKQQKQVLSVEFSGKIPSVASIPVPSFQKLESLKGDWKSLCKKLNELGNEKKPVWLEITYTGSEVIGDLRGQLEDITKGTKLEILRVKNNPLVDQVLQRMSHEETLEELRETEVFQRTMNAHQIPEEQQSELLDAFHEILTDIHENDLHAE